MVFPQLSISYSIFVMVRGLRNSAEKNIRKAKGWGTVYHLRGHVAKCEMQ